MIIIVLLLLGLVVFLFFSRSGDSKVVGKINPQAVAVRRSMLRTTDDRVHEQFAMLFAAATVTAELSHPMNFANANSMTSDGKDRWISLQLSESLICQGFHPSILRLKLARYVFDLYMPFFIRRNDSSLIDISLAGELGIQICREGAKYLDEQFEREGRADACSFLKGEPIEGGPIKTKNLEGAKPRASAVVTREELRAKAEHGDAAAQAATGAMYANGEGTGVDMFEAQKWFRKAAEQGNARGQSGLGVLYARGDGGLSKDPTAALKWLGEAVEQGDANAEYYLGFMYARGELVIKNSAKALEFFRKAALHGHIKAQLELGRALVDRGETGADVLDGMAWALVSAQGGLPEAIKAVDAMNKSIASDLTTDAKRRSEEIISTIAELKMRETGQRNGGPKSEQQQAELMTIHEEDKQRKILIGGIEATARRITEDEGRTQHDAEFLAIVTFLDDLQTRPNGRAGARILVDIARNEYAQHFNDVLMYLGWRDRRLILKTEIEKLLIARLDR